MLAACEARGFRLATAESCTGGLIIACLTEIPGSSNVVERGYVTYDNRAKEEMLGDPVELLQRVGAVSQEVARRDGRRARCARAGVDLAIAVTGIAGPGGAHADQAGRPRPHRARRGGRPPLHERHVPGRRAAVRAAPSTPRSRWCCAARRTQPLRRSNQDSAKARRITALIPFQQIVLAR